VPRLIAFLRAINVGGHTVKMEELKQFFEAVGCRNVQTFIASGNVVFESSATNIAALQGKIEGHLRKSLGYDVETFIRTESEVAAIARYRPFPEAQLESAKTLNVAFLGEPLSADAKKSLMRLRSEIDEFHVHGREVYWLCRTSQSESTFSNMVFEKKLGTRTTFRGLKTVERLAAKHSFSPTVSARPFRAR
jgi:uncharacterized protein (DUF1697 family)